MKALHGDCIDGGGYDTCPAAAGALAGGHSPGRRFDG